jgi:hypothetical protein
MSNSGNPTLEELNPLNSPEESEVYIQLICDEIMLNLHNDLNGLRVSVLSNFDAIDEYYEDDLNTPAAVRGLLEKILTTEEVTKFFEAEVELAVKRIDGIEAPKSRQTIQKWLDEFDEHLAIYLGDTIPHELPDAFKHDLKQIITKGFIKLILPSDAEIAELKDGGYLSRPVIEMTENEFEAFARRIIIFTTEEFEIAKERDPERYKNPYNLRPFITSLLESHLTEEQIESLLDQGVDMSIATKGQIASQMATIRVSDWIDMFAESLINEDEPGKLSNDVFERVFTKALKTLRDQAKMNKDSESIQPLAAEIKASFALLEDMLDDGEGREMLRTMVLDLKEKVAQLLKKL